MHVLVSKAVSRNVCLVMLMVVSSVMAVSRNVCIVVPMVVCSVKD